MKTKLTIEVDIELVEEFEDDNQQIGCVYYPDEGNKIQIKKGLNIIELSDVIHHEIGHLFDWYLSNGQQSKHINIREENAEVIGESLRLKQNSDLKTTVVLPRFNTRIDQISEIVSKLKHSQSDEYMKLVNIFIEFMDEETKEKIILVDHSPTIAKLSLEKVKETHKKIMHTESLLAELVKLNKTKPVVGYRPKNYKAKTIYRKRAGGRHISANRKKNYK